MSHLEALQGVFCEGRAEISVLLQLDNQTAVQYHSLTNTMGGTVSL